MKTVITGGKSFLTGGEIADAITAYGLALARVRDLDVVDIPFVSADGSVHRAQLRIGWMIDTIITSNGQSLDDLIEADTILGILLRTQALGGPRDPDVHWAKSEPHVQWRGPQLRRTVNWDEVI